MRRCWRVRFSTCNPVYKMKLAPLLALAVLFPATPCSSQIDQGAWHYGLPPGSTARADDGGRYVKCLPPPGEKADKDFRRLCKQFLEKVKKVRVAKLKGAWLSAADYPLLLRGSGASGRTTVSMDVDETGTVSACAVVASSGNAVLDQAACSAAISRARFSPSLDMDGRPVPSVYTQSVNWQAG